MNSITGIDFGTTSSCVGVWQGDHVKIIENDHGQRTTPSFVAFTNSERLIGSSAEKIAAINSLNTVFNAKSLIGRHYTDLSDMKYWSFTVTEKSRKPYIRVQFKGKTKEFTAEEICSMIIGKLKDSAEVDSGKKVTDAVIAVPVYFNYSQRQSIRDACSIAGLNVLSMINESTCAGITYGFKYKSKVEKNVLIFDLGGNGLSISIMNIKDKNFTVKAIAGDSHLGGEDFDNLLVNYFAQEFKRKTNLDIFNNPRSLRRLRTACERAKRTLSCKFNATIEIDSLYNEIDFYSSITRDIFENLCSDLFKRSIELIEKALIDSKLDKFSIDEVIPVGGSTRIPKIQSLISQFFYGKKLFKSINKDEAVAFGATIEAAKYSGELNEDLSLLDVCPYSFGIQSADGVMTTVIERHKPIPTVKSKILNCNNYSTIKVFELENSYTKPNSYQVNSNSTNILNEFELTNIHPLTKIEVIFNIDSVFQLNISVYDLTTGGRIKNITIDNKNRLSGKEIECMVNDSKKYKAADIEIEERNEAKNNLESYTYTLRNFAQQLSNAIEETIKWLDDNQDTTKDKYKSRKKDLEHVINPIITDIHQTFNASGSIPTV